jgi:hypothetical protein
MIFSKAETVTEITALAEQFRAALLRLDMLAVCAPSLELGTLRREVNAVRTDVGQALTGDEANGT